MKNNSIKKTLPRLAVIMIMILVVLISAANLWIQFRVQDQKQRESAEEMFAQLEQLIEGNQKNLQERKELFSEKCLHSAEMAAYLVQQNPEIAESSEEARKMADRLDVDELHVFSPEGVIYGGSHPQYYGLSFNSGEQMSYFLPMLKDRSLKLCQEITPNTAEGKAMQYAAVWTEDGSGIVQIGMMPERLLAETEDYTLKKMVSEIPLELQGNLHIIDKQDKTVIASTGGGVIGNDVSRMMKTQEQYGGRSSFYYEYQGDRYCVYTKDYREYLMVRTYGVSGLVLTSLKSTIIVLIYTVIISVGVIGIILWYVNRHLSRNLDHIVKELRQIEKGTLQNISIRTGIPEFDELIYYIGRLLESIRKNWSRLSSIIDRGRIPVGIYEETYFGRKKVVNERILEILGMHDSGQYTPEEQAERVREVLEEIETQNVDEENSIFEYCRNGQHTYLRVEKVSDEQGVLYYVTDISMWWNEINVFREQSVRDILTGLYNRRGFQEEVNELLKEPDKLGCGAVLIIDADGLKKINDLWGHSEGDAYLLEIVESLSAVPEEHSVCARLGGDEFVIFLHGYKSAAGVENAISELLAGRGRFFRQGSGGEVFTVEFSEGHAYYPLDGQDIWTLMHLADANMYREKKRRKFLSGGGRPS